MSEFALKQEVEQLRREVAELREQVALLAAGKPTPAAAKHKIVPKTDTIDEETMLIISAAVAAFLGKRATIKLVRPVHQGLDGWRVQGRVAIHGSHSTR